LSARGEWQAINVLRGVAGLYMVADHLYAELRVPLALGPVGELGMFAASCAPVLFFAVTGLGYGVGGPRRGAIAASSWSKIGLLLVADQLLFWRMGRVAGLDFLGFIALSSLALELVARARRPVSLAGALAAAVVLARYGLGSNRALAALGADNVYPLRLALGASGLESVGYPPLPWLAYPLLGFVAGSLLRERARAVVVTSLGVGAICALVGALALRGGAPIFRWGTVSAAFFALSFGVLAASVSLTLALERAPALARAIELRGISSLALVPLHYVFIALAERLGLEPDAEGALAVAAFAIAALSFASAHAFARAVEARVSKPLPLAAPFALLATVPLAFLVLLGGTPPDRLAAACAMAVAQLALCILMALRWPSQSHR
jgi:uncharacterized membrane protein